jgi:branched-chain amino acid transport system ATP-binding protein
MAAILECVEVTKAYGGLLAVKGLSFSAEQGEIFAIVGPNGAGKTTLFDAISGISPATRGIIRFDGQEIQRLGPDRICRHGIARTFQTTVSFDTQTALNNVLVGSIFGAQGRGQPTQRVRPEGRLCRLWMRWSSVACSINRADRRRCSRSSSASG